LSGADATPLSDAPAETSIDELSRFSVSSEFASFSDAGAAPLSAASAVSAETSIDRLSCFSFSSEFGSFLDADVAPLLA